MNSHPKQHISDETMSDLLASPSDPASDTELLELKAALGSYRKETLVWAERRSATQPSLAAKATPSPWAAAPQWSLAAVALVAVAAGVVHAVGYGTRGAAPQADASIASASTATTPDQIEADNQLLGSIDQALQYDPVSPTMEYRMQPARITRHAQGIN